MMVSRRPPPLADTLGVLLPDAQDALLLQACLGGARVAGEAWGAWLSAASGLSAALRDRPSWRGLLPLLHHNLDMQGIAVCEPALAVLRAATLWEERRASRIRAILAQILALLRQAEIDAVLIGAAAAASAYPKFALRHCHDIALLLEADALAPADTALRAAGFRAEPGAEGPRPSSPLALRHGEGLPVTLHGMLWPPTGKESPIAAFRRRARAIDIEAESVPVFAPMDMLMHLCGHGFAGPDLSNWAWIADAAMIQNRHSPSREDWAGFVRTARDSGLAFRLALRLDDLAARIALAIPADVVDELIEAAWQCADSDKDAALSAARNTFGLGLGAMLRQGGWRSRFDTARWALRRSPRILRRWTRI
jgi:hypothetical protein